MKSLFSLRDRHIISVLSFDISSSNMKIRFRNLKTTSEISTYGMFGLIVVLCFVCLKISIRNFKDCELTSVSN